MNTTIDNLRQQAQEELEQETTPTDTTNEAMQPEPTNEQSEVIAEIISFDKLQAKLSEANNANDKLKVLFSDMAKLADDDIEAKLKLNEQINTLLNSSKNEVLQIAVNLPKYYLLNENGTSYLVPVPKIEAKQKGTSIGTTEKSKYPAPFSVGDTIYLINKDQTIKSQTYQVTLAGLIGNDDHEPIKAGKAVENFMVNQLGHVLPANFKGFPGTSHPYFRKVQL